MILSVNSHSIGMLFSKDSNCYYVIPKYQREYTWGQNQWRDLYDDINENRDGYFIGSIIGINNSNNAVQKNPLEVVDGQQRLTTLSLLLASIYKKLLEYKDQLKDNDDDFEEFLSLRKALICESSPNGLILCPQVQNCNAADFVSVMFDSVLLGNKSLAVPQKERNWGNRKIAKCYKYFLKRLEDDVSASDNPVETILALKKKVSKAVLVMIQVGSHAEAYTLFESLNNRGTPLTAIDLMKNLILAQAEEKHLNGDDCFNAWQTLLSYLTDNYATQERFFRQYYNAFKNRLNELYRAKEPNKKDPLGSIATRSNLLDIFETLIKDDLSAFLQDILIAGRIYSQLILSSEEKNELSRDLTNLSRIQGTPSYLLLLYLFKNQTELEIDNQSLLNTIKLLTRFFIRRNITDTPNTRDLSRIFMSIIAQIEEQTLKGCDIDSLIRNELLKWAASDDLFREKLSGNIYEENVGVTRYVLCDLAEQTKTKETWVDFWARIENKDKKAFNWTIEHIFPEGESIPECWVDMIANGDRSLANQYRENFVHKLGNLTITAYNSNLSNLSFIKKRDRTNKEGHYIGYKNGLEINKELAEKDSWTTRDIDDRTKDMVNKLMEMYAL